MVPSIISHDEILEKLGDAKCARALLEERSASDSEARVRGDESSRIPLDVAYVHAVRGEAEGAIRWLRKALEAAWTDSATAIKDPLMEGLRNDPAFLDVLAQLERSVL